MDEVMIPIRFRPYANRGQKSTTHDTAKGVDGIRNNHSIERSPT